MNYVKSNYPKNTRVIFKLDHYDASQDDLRRFMELDAENRRYLISSSIKAARENDCYFACDLDSHCGCTPMNVVGDPNEIIIDKKGERTTQYDAFLCGDDDTIAKSFRRYH